MWHFTAELCHILFMSDDKINVSSRYDLQWDWPKKRKRGEIKWKSIRNTRRKWAVYEAQGKVTPSDLGW